MILLLKRIIVLVVCLMLCGCCVWEEADMSKPMGCVLHLIEIQCAAGTPVGCLGALSSDCGFPHPDWPSVPLSFTWVPLDSDIHITYTLNWNCTRERSQLYYGTGLVYPSPSGWSVYDALLGAEWSLTPEPPGYATYIMVIDLASLIALLPGGTGTIWLLTVCGPSNLAGQGLPPAVTGVTPV